MKFARILIALLLIPLALALAVELFNLVLNLGKNATVNSITFWAGLASYFIFQTALFKPIKTYVFGHELTHALVGLLSGAKVKGFNVGANGGSVKLTKTNVWITLSPYFIPIYTVLLIFIYWLAGYFWAVNKYYSYFLFLAGFTLAFHLSLTWYAILQGQTDFKVFGVFFSSIFILIINCILLSGLLKLLFPEMVSIKTYYYLSYNKTAVFWNYIYVEGIKLWVSFRSMK
ncbi:MAG: hypothetical protein LHV68_04670 [Elusimicrobia bacterium]|nr:hypothetical protein [Candidatus Liberimonas magnetica]